MARLFVASGASNPGTSGNGLEERKAGKHIQYIQKQAMTSQFGHTPLMYTSERVP
jgi:hypothetical protein